MSFSRIVEVPLWALVVLGLLLLVSTRGTYRHVQSLFRLKRERDSLLAEIDGLRMVQVGLRSDIDFLMSVIGLVAGLNLNRRHLSTQLKRFFGEHFPTSKFRVVYEKTGHIYWSTGRLWVGKQSEPIAEYDRVKVYLSQGGENRLFELQLLAKLVSEWLEVLNLAEKDGLTHLPRRRSFSTLMNREVARSKRQNHELSVLFMDLDNFSLQNDTYGHHWGDEVLRQFASLLRKHHRLEDYPARWGGEEFVLLLPETGAEEAERVAENIRRETCNTNFGTKLDDRRVTVSIGIATYPEDGQDSHELLVKADAAMYQSKVQGRNRVTRWSMETGIEPGRL